MAFSFNKLLVSLVPNGTYKAEVSKVEFVQSKNNAEQYNCRVTLTIKEGTYAKRTVLDTISTAYISRFKQFLQSAKVDLNKEYSTINELFNAGAKAATGKELMIKVSSKTYNGNDYNQVDEYTPIPGSTTTAAEVLKEFTLDSAEVKPEVTPEVAVNVTTEPSEVAAVNAPVEDVEPQIDIDLNILK